MPAKNKRKADPVPQDIALKRARTGVEIDGLQYKIGHRDKAFILIHGDWCLSTRTPAEIIQAAGGKA